MSGESWRDMALRLNGTQQWTKGKGKQSGGDWSKGAGKGAKGDKGKGSWTDPKKGKGKGSEAKGKAKGKGKGSDWPCPVPERRKLNGRWEYQKRHQRQNATTAEPRRRW